MTPEQFLYWLQGYFELSDDTDRLSKREHIIRDHLKKVFEKRTPDYQITTTGDPIWHKKSSPDEPTFIC